MYIGPTPNPIRQPTGRESAPIDIENALYLNCYKIKII